MIQTDTLQVLNDSIHKIPYTLAKLDSIARVDSLKGIADSLKVIVNIPRGFVGIPHPSLPQTESWVFIVIVLLFFLLVFSVSGSAGLIAETMKSFLQVKERSSIFSKATVNDSRLRLLLVSFSICVLSLYVYLMVFNPSGHFSIKNYGFLLIATGLFFGIKSLIFEMIGYIFLTPSTLKMGKESYFNIVSILGVILFPLLILQIYVPSGLYNMTEMISLIMCLSACILVIIKLFQIFFHKTVASFYILLYLCTLEILPLIVLFRVYKLIL